MKHPLPARSAPSAEEAARSRLFSPLRLASGLELGARTWVPAMVPWRATSEGFVTAEVVAWYRRFAEGEPGALVVEATGIRDVPSGPLLRAGHERFVSGLSDLVRGVRDASGGRTRLFLQLIDFLRIRRRPERARFFAEYLVLGDSHRAAVAGAAAMGQPPSDREVRARLAALDDRALETILSAREREALRMGERERVTDTELAHIADLPRSLPALFAGAAERAERAGFDGVELHFAHAYTMASFLSRRNDRTDGYGGSIEERARLPLEVIRAVRAATSPAFTLGCRMLADEIIEGGSRTDEAARFAIAFAGAGLDFISLSTGGKFEDAAQPKVGEAAYPYTGESGYECMPTVHSDARGPFGRNIDKHAAVRAQVRAAGFTTPIVVAGGIASYAQAEAILVGDRGDVVAAARQSLADPDWWKKVRSGRGSEVRPCLFTNYCEALDQKHKPVTCQQWDRLELDEAGALLTIDRKRRLVAPPDRAVLPAIPPRRLA